MRSISPSALTTILRMPISWPKSPLKSRRMVAWKAHLERRGVPTEGPLQLGFPGQASRYFNDPSGNHLELVCHGYGKPIPIRPPEMTTLAWKTGDV